MARKHTSQLWHRFFDSRPSSPEAGAIGLRSGHDGGGSTVDSAQRTKLTKQLQARVEQGFGLAGYGYSRLFLAYAAWDVDQAYKDIHSFFDACDGIVYAPPVAADELASMQGFQNDGGTSCYIDALLFAMYFGLICFDPMLLGDPLDPSLLSTPASPTSPTATTIARSRLWPTQSAPTPPVHSTNQATSSSSHPTPRRHHHRFFRHHRRHQRSRSNSQEKGSNDAKDTKDDNVPRMRRRHRLHRFFTTYRRPAAEDQRDDDIAGSQPLSPSTVATASTFVEHTEPLTTSTTAETIAATLDDGHDDTAKPLGENSRRSSSSTTPPPTSSHLTTAISTDSDDQQARAPHKKLQVELRFLINKFRHGGIVTDVSMARLRTVMKDSGWYATRDQEDASELFLFLTTIFDHPYLPFQLRLFHGGKVDQDDDRLMTDRLLPLCLPEEKIDKKDGKTEEIAKKKKIGAKDDAKTTTLPSSSSSLGSTIPKPLPPPPSPPPVETAEPELRLEALLVDHFYNSVVTGLRRQVDVQLQDGSGGGGITMQDEEPDLADQEQQGQMQEFDLVSVASDADSDSDKGIEVTTVEYALSDTPKVKIPHDASARESQETQERQVDAWQAMELLPFYSSSNEQGDTISYSQASFPDTYLLLPIVLKRYKLQGSLYTKDNRRVQIPATIPFHRFVNQNTHAACLQCRADMDYLLRLRSVVCHHGTSPHAGHYTAYAKSYTDPSVNDDQDWYKLDDMHLAQRVSKVTESQVLDDAAQTGYLFFYELTCLCTACLETSPPSSLSTASPSVHSNDKEIVVTKNETMEPLASSSSSLLSPTSLPPTTTTATATALATAVSTASVTPSVTTQASPVVQATALPPSRTSTPRPPQLEATHTNSSDDARSQAKRGSCTIM
ncbi:hypothetical protein BC940DRAFT_293572 [Gongronella butleri]|nr:hypothetical protein BC940DRAFT_293572 [Gongronella butleri]